MGERGCGRGLIVVNPAARGGAVGLASEVRDWCGRWVDRLDVVRTSTRGGAVGVVAGAVRESSSGEPLDVVVAVGGDGTVREVAEGIARGAGRWPTPAVPRDAGELGPALLVVPAGTGNSVYRALWADRPWAEVAAEALGSPRPTVRRLDLGRVVESDIAFLLGASAGFLARVVAVAETMTDVAGRERYQVAAGAALADLRAFPGRVTVDGAVLHDGPLALVAVGGARHRAGTFQLLPRSVLDDGLLDVCVVGELTAERFVELAGLVVEGRHVGQPGVAYAQGRCVVLERTDGEPLAFEHDGDVWAGSDTVLTLEVVPGAVPAFASGEE